MKPRIERYLVNSVECATILSRNLGNQREWLE